MGSFPRERGALDKGMQGYKGGFWSRRGGGDWVAVISPVSSSHSADLGVSFPLGPSSFNLLHSPILSRSVSHHPTAPYHTFLIANHTNAAVGYTSLHQTASPTVSCRVIITRRAREPCSIRHWVDVVAPPSCGALCLNALAGWARSI